MSVSSRPASAIDSILKKKRNSKAIWAIGQCVLSILNAIWANLGKGAKERKHPPFLGSTWLTPADPDPLLAP